MAGGCRRSSLAEGSPGERTSAPRSRTRTGTTPPRTRRARRLSRRAGERPEPGLPGAALPRRPAGGGGGAKGAAGWNKGNAVFCFRKMSLYIGGEVFEVLFRSFVEAVLAV